MRILVVGAGVLGFPHGGWLKESGNDVILVDIWSQHIDVINDANLKNESETGIQAVHLIACFAEGIQEKVKGYISIE